MRFRPKALFYNILVLLFNLGETDHARKVSLGKRLTERRDQVIDDYRIKRAGEAQRAALWQLVSGEK